MADTPEPSPAPGGKPDSDALLEREIAAALGDQSIEQLMEASMPPESSPEGHGSESQEPTGSAPPGGASKSHRAPEPQRFVHDMVRGRIAGIRGDDVFVDLVGIGGKNQGLVPLTQFDRPPRIGSVMDFVVQRYDEDEGLVILSREGAVSRATWEQLQRGAITEGRVVAANKGGLEIEMIGGIRAFMPASQIDLHHVDDLPSFVGQKLQGVVQEIDRHSRKVVLSRRQLLEHERQVKQQKAWEELEVGQFREGKVSSLAEYGAFVDLGGIDGLIHISDMSYSRIAKPGDLLKVGEAVKVKILKVDREKKRVSLGLKQVAPDPWDGIAGRLKHGDQVSGRVLRVADFGAFVEVLPGIEGLLPVSEMSWKRIHNSADAVKEGDVLRLVVLNLDAEKRRLSLSLEQAGGDPWMGAEHKFAKNSVVEAMVLSTTDFGAFMELEPGVEGLVHISELSDRRVNAVTDVVKIGEKHQVRVLEVDEEKRRIRLSIKAAKEAPPQPEPALTAPAAEAAVKAPDKAKPRKPGKSLKGGMEHASMGIGLGQLKL